VTEYAPDPDCLFCDGEGVDADPYDRFDYPCYEACPECWPVQKVGTTYGEAAAYDSGVRAGIAEERARVLATVERIGQAEARGLRDTPYRAGILWALDRIRDAITYMKEPANG
jgi:hypothetical protein